MKTGCPFGTHRVIEPKGVLPQPAWQICNDMEIFDNEILVDVRTLNVDSASFTQIKKEAGGDEAKIAETMLGIVAKRGKHHNPVTGSGGMFIGTVAKIGPALAHRDLKVGDKIASLVSLSLTPLKINKILAIHKDTDQVDIDGQAVLFESGIYAKLPADMDEKLALAVLDVAGAPAQTAKLVRPGHTVFIIGGGGKSGLLCGYEAKKRAGVTGKIIGLCPSENSAARARESGFYDAVILGDATKPIEILEKVKAATNGQMADLTINCVNVPGTEMASILATKNDGMIYFFSMATSFTAAALGAEGIGSDATMLVGNGYTKDHAAIALNELRESPKLREMFEKLYVK